MAIKQDYDYTSLYTNFFRIIKEKGGRGYSPMLLREVRPVKPLEERSANAYEAEDNLVYFYAETEAQILKKQIIRKPDGELLMVMSIRPQHIEVVPDAEMVRLIVNKIMGYDYDDVLDEQKHL